VDGLHSGVVMRCGKYVDPQDGAMSILLSSQEEAFACMLCIQKENHCYEGWLSVNGKNQECRSLRKG
jgi:hypothetical protein